MVYVDFCKGQNGTWIGCAEYNNGRYFATGRTLDVLMSNIKTGGGRVFRISSRNFMLSSRQMDIGEFEQKHIKYASQIFKTRYWDKKEDKIIPMKKEPKNKERNGRRVVVDGVLYKSIAEAEEKLNTRRGTIGQALRHNQTRAVGYTIAYADELPQFKKPTIKLEEPEIEIEKPKIEEPKTEMKHYYEEKDGVLYVYERRLVAKYEVENAK